MNVEFKKERVFAHEPYVSFFFVANVRNNESRFRLSTISCSEEHCMLCCCMQFWKS